MFHDLWPQLPLWEVPITSITNGVHLPSWLNGDLALLYDQYLEPTGASASTIPRSGNRSKTFRTRNCSKSTAAASAAWYPSCASRQHSSALRRQASSLEVRRSGEVLDPNAFTIGFARRFATYKRATLLFRDVERLKRILLE